MISAQPSAKFTSPVFGLILIGIAALYLIVLAIQVVKARSRRERHQFESDSEYTDMSVSDSRGLYRRDLEQLDSVPNTCSYTESQMYTPNHSVYSVEDSNPLP